MKAINGKAIFASNFITAFILAILYVAFLTLSVRTIVA